MSNVKPKLYTEKDFKKFLKEAKDFWKGPSSVIQMSLYFNFFYKLIDNFPRNYNIDRITEGIDWLEPAGHVGTSCTVIHEEGGAKLLKYWWHDKPIVSVNHPYEYKDIYKLYLWMGENGYNVNTAE